MNNINKENIQETKPEDYNDKYFKYLCILPWICLGLWLLETPVLLASWKAVELAIEGNHDAFETAVNEMQNPVYKIIDGIVRLSLFVLIILNVYFVKKDKEALNKCNIAVKKNLVIHTIATIIFNALTIDSYFWARKRVLEKENLLDLEKANLLDVNGKIKTGRVHSMTPFLLIVALWLYLLFTKLSMGM